MNGREKSELGRSSCEACEQNRHAGGGAGGAKGRDRGECDPAKHVPDTGPGRRVTGKFTALLHHVTPEALRAAFYAIAKNAAAGIDGITWRDYEADLERKLADLHDRVHSGAYRATPSRRVYIPKPDGGQRPLRAVADVLNAIYEEDFLGFSYGFWPGRGAHDALDALSAAIYARKVNYIVDADIAKFFELGEQRMARSVPRTSHRRQARSPPDPEMASGGRSRRRTDRGS